LKKYGEEWVGLSCDLNDSHLQQESPVGAPVPALTDVNHILVYRPQADQVGESAKILDLH
jgi:hypothetical protein